MSEQGIGREQRNEGISYRSSAVTTIWSCRRNAPCGQTSRSPIDCARAVKLAGRLFLVTETMLTTRVRVSPSVCFAPTCWQFRVKGLTTMANSPFNGWRMEHVWLDK